MVSRGDKELHCLERVIRYVFPNEASLHAEDADVSLLHSSVFGFSQEDWQKLCEILALAKPNDNPNEFPDFVSRKSVLEHFEISATRESKKGSAFKRGHEPFTKSVREKLGEIVVAEEPQVVKDTFKYPDLHHRLLLDSLKRNLENHIKSLSVYAASHEVTSTVFVIEHQEYGLSMLEDVYGEVGEGCVFGDIRSQQQYSNYRMSRDKEALALLFGHEDVLDIVVFVGVEYIEFIKISEIPDMIKLMPWLFVVAAGPTVELHSFVPVMRTYASEEEQDDYE